MTDLIRDDDLVKLLEDGATVVEESWDGLANIDDMVDWVKRARAALSAIRLSTACSTAAAPISQEQGSIAATRLSEGGKNAPHGWVWLDDDGWEHDPNPQHPQERGEAEYGTEFRPATAEEAVSVEFYRAPKVIITFGGSDA